MNEGRMYPNCKDIVKQEYLKFWFQNSFMLQDAKELCVCVGWGGSVIVFSY